MQENRDERAFLEIVRRFRGIGYGRMLQIISHEWYRHDPNGAALADTCYALLGKKKQKAYIALAESDPIFQEN